MSKILIGIAIGYFVVPFLLEIPARLNLGNREG